LIAHDVKMINLINPLTPTVAIRVQL